MCGISLIRPENISTIYIKLISAWYVALGKKKRKFYWALVQGTKFKDILWSLGHKVCSTGTFNEIGQVFYPFVKVGDTRVMQGNVS